MFSRKQLRCSFCGTAKESVNKLICGPSVYICGGCVDVCNRVLGETENQEAAAAVPAEWDQRVRCSFCGKHRASVTSLIHGPGVNVCNECVGLCNGILAEYAAVV